jgi:TIR domain
MQAISGPSVVAFLEYMRIKYPKVFSLRDLRSNELDNYIFEFEKFRLNADGESFRKLKRCRNHEFELDTRYTTRLWGDWLRFIGHSQNHSYEDAWPWYWRSNQYDPLERYLTIPNRGIFLFTSQDTKLRNYIKKHYMSFHERSGDRLDIYDYTIRNNNLESFSRNYIASLAPVPGVKADIRLPCLILWSNYGDVIIPMGDLDTSKKILTRMNNIYEIIRTDAIDQQGIDELLCIEYFDKNDDKQPKETEATPCDIFISYSHTDKKQVQRLVDKIDLKGVKTWHDESIRYGERFVPRIFSQINASKMVVVCWSEKAVKSSWVKSEARYALKSDKKLWPIYIQAHESDFGHSIPDPFGQHHTATLPVNDDQALNEMAERIYSACV